MNAKLAPAPEKARMVDGWLVGEGTFPVHSMARLVYYARLAPSSHNTQPWKFVAGECEIDVLADLDRWMRVADSDRRELHLSLGCATEALRIAADFGGWGSAVSYFPIENDTTFVARLRFALDGPKRELSAADLLRHLLARRTSHRLFDPARPPSERDRKRLTTCFQVGDVSLHYLKERPALDALAAVESRADAALFSRADYRAELAQRVGEGMMGSAWLVSKLGQLAVGLLPVAERMAHQDAERLASAPLVALLTTRHDTRVDQVQAGEAFMRIALVAEAHGIRVQPMSQVMEVAETRTETSRIFGLGDRVAQHLFRLGHAQAETRPHRRRPMDDILIEA